MDSLPSLETHLQLYEIMLSAAKPMAVRAAVLLNIPDIIDIHGQGNSLSVEEIANYISVSTNKPAHMDYLFRILRFLASIGVFIEETTVVSGGITTQFKYGLTSLSKLLVKKDNKESSGPMFLVTNEKCVLHGYQHIHESVVEGCYAFNKAHGMDMFEYNRNNPEINRIFNEGVASHANAVMASVVKMYNGFNSVKSVVDVGGGIGSALCVIIKEYPHIHGINFDLPHVIKNAPPIYGVEHVEGDMFQKIPNGDAVFMKWILHDWENERCVELLKKIHEAIPENGKVIIVEAIIDGKEDDVRRVGLLFDMCTMAYTPGGRERTEEQLQELFKKAGFRSYTILKLPFVQALIELSK